MKQRKRIKQYKKELNQYSDYLIESFEFDIKTAIRNNENINRISIQIYQEYFADLQKLFEILRKKQLHIIKQICNEWEIYSNDFSDLLNDMEAVYENAFDDKEVYNFSDLLR